MSSKNGRRTDRDNGDPTFADLTIDSRAARDHAEPFPGVDIAQIRSDSAKLKADQVSLVRSRLASSATGTLSKAAAKLYNSPADRLSDQDYKAFAGQVGHAVRLAQYDKELRELEQTYRREIVTDQRDRDPYAKGSPDSWIVDRLTVSGDKRFGDTRANPGAEERLARLARIVADAVDRRSKYGKAIERQYVEQFRSNDARVNRQAAEKGLQEFRALVTGGGATASASTGASAFVAPAILLEAWAEYRSPFASFVSQCDDSIPLPSYGLQAYVPVVTTGTQVGTDTEGSGTPETDPVAGFASGAIVQKAGQIQLSQAVLDRVGPGIGGDVVLWQQLKNQLMAAVDAYALTLVITGAATVTNSGTFALTGATAGVNGFMADLKKAKSKLTDTAGVRLRGTHCFALDDFVDYIGAYNDAQGRPVFSPAFDDNRLPIKSVGDQGAEGFSGYVLNGLALFGDSNTPNSGSNLQIVVCRPDSILQLNGEVVPYLYPQFQASNMEPVIGVRQYVTTIAKYASGVAVISGAAYAASTFA